VVAQCDKLATAVDDNTSRRKTQFSLTSSAFNLPLLDLAPPLRMTACEFCQDFRHQKASPGLLCAVVCMILRLTVSVKHQLVTDGRTDRETDRQTTTVSNCDS